MNTKLIKTKGVVLAETNYSETDKILTILTYNLGKISCIAKGARRIQSRFLASSQIFAFSDFLLFKGSGDIYYINSAELIESFYPLRNDFDKIECAMECVRFTKEYVLENEDVSINIIKLLLNTLYILTLDGKNINLIKDVFMIKMFCYLGYVPNFSQCTECGKRENLVAFSLKTHGLKCRECSNKKDLSLQEGTIAAIRYIIGSNLKNVFSFNVIEDISKEIDIFTKLYTEILKTD
ncbi:MAG: DNA repair protein RecO [Clostridia bacterium]|nr:DNA repair protein RecO [Clostridia bacterium]